MFYVFARYCSIIIVELYRQLHYYKPIPLIITHHSHVHHLIVQIKTYFNVLFGFHYKLFLLFFYIDDIIIIIIIIIIKGLTSLTEISSLFSDGAHHPTLLVVLQALMNLIGQVIWY